MEDIVRTVYQDENNEDLVSHALTDNVLLTEFDCYYPIVDAFHSRCYNLGTTDYAIRMLNVFVNLCEGGVESNTVIQALRVHCPDQPASRPEPAVSKPSQLFSLSYVYTYVTALFR